MFRFAANWGILPAIVTLISPIDFDNEIGSTCRTIGIADNVSCNERHFESENTETLAIIAYHQPITRSEIENIRGVSLSRGTLDLLLELGWIQPGQRRTTPGNPLTWKTSNKFLDHFGLKEIKDLPEINDLKKSGLLDKNKIIFSDQVIE